MKVGDLYTGNNSLYIVGVIDTAMKAAELFVIVAPDGSVIDYIPLPIPIVFNNKRITPVAYGSIPVLSIMLGRPFPHWVHMITAQASVSMASNAPQAPSQPQGATGYPIGTIFLGTSKAGNVWIVNTDNTRSISKLWDGKQARWCTSEVECPDQLKIGPWKPVTAQETLDFINRNNGMSITLPYIPPWVKSLLLTPHKAPNAPPLQSTGMSPAVVNALTKANVLAPRVEHAQIKIDSTQDKCDHSFKSYIGFREVYDYCLKCDFKIRAKQ